jgi:hypothetical protein
LSESRREALTKQKKIEQQYQKVRGRGGEQVLPLACQHSKQREKHMGMGEINNRATEGGGTGLRPVKHKHQNNKR